MTAESERGWAQNQHVVQHIFPECRGDAESVPGGGKTAVTGAWPPLGSSIREESDRVWTEKPSVNWVELDWTEVLVWTSGFRYEYRNNRPMKVFVRVYVSAEIQRWERQRETSKDTDPTSKGLLLAKSGTIRVSKQKKITMEHNLPQWNMNMWVLMYICNRVRLMLHIFTLLLG